MPEMSDMPLLGLLWYAVFLFSATLHEAAHAALSYWGGDRTAYEGGQVTLDPLPHMRREPVGMIAVPIISFIMYGGTWMFGFASAPYDPRWANQYPRRSALMSLAGPLSNLLLCLVAAAFLRAGLAAGVFTRLGTWDFIEVVGTAQATGFWRAIVTVLSILFNLNLLLCLLNLTPLPPFDGSGAVPLILPRRWCYSYFRFLHGGSFHLIGLIAGWLLLRRIFFPVLRVMLNVLGLW